MNMQRAIRLAFVCSCIAFTMSALRAIWHIGGASFFRPRIECDGWVFDFGSARTGSIVEHDFILKNNGGEQLLITDVRPFCEGCTRCELESPVVRPGGTSVLNVRLDLADLRGQQVKGVLVTSNDPATPSRMLYLRGNSVADLAIEPSRINIGRIRSGDKVLKAVKLYTTAGAGRKSFAVVAVHTSDARLRVRHQTTKAHQHLLMGSFHAERTLGVVRCWITVTTDHPVEHSIRIPFTAEVVDGSGTVAINAAGVASHDAAISGESSGRK